MMSSLNAFFNKHLLKADLEGHQSNISLIALGCALHEIQHLFKLVSLVIDFILPDFVQKVPELFTEPKIFVILNFEPADGDVS